MSAEWPLPQGRRHHRGTDNIRLQLCGGTKRNTGMAQPVAATRCRPRPISGKKIEVGGRKEVRMSITPIRRRYRILPTPQARIGETLTIATSNDRFQQRRRHSRMIQANSADETGERHKIVPARRPRDVGCCEFPCHADDSASASRNCSRGQERGRGASANRYRPRLHLPMTRAAQLPRWSTTVQALVTIAVRY